ncbi:SDR family oxidoreductase [Arcticibacter sp.]|jgi:short-subunit dehydrogenase|uniref:SDR family oxidoreductase n=1 Tax=Arcticibacter sp. TaxID=1872630 RepID=UPI00388D5101
MKDHRKKLAARAPLSQKTVVIAGASSGIGRATALEFARRGSSLILLARRIDTLQQVAEQCLDAGARLALAVQADVTKPENLRDAVKIALEATGKIDVWINNAGGGAVGTFEEIPLDVHHKVIETNLLGHINGTYHVLPVFKQQGYGTLINTISVGAFAPEPYVVAYSASKYGLRGFSESLRCELLHWPDIHVCDIFPAYIDTPGFQHAANYTGKKIKPVPPVFEARRVAKAMVRLARRPKDAVNIGETAGLYKAANAIAPALFRRVVTGIMDNYFHRAKPASIGTGHLFKSGENGTGISGGWLQETSPAKKSLLFTAVAAGLGVGFLLFNRR